MPNSGLDYAHDHAVIRMTSRRTERQPTADDAPLSIAVHCRRAPIADHLLTRSQPISRQSAQIVQFGAPENRIAGL
jgi:hypothetical protein